MAGFQHKSDRIWGIFGYFHLLRHLKVVPAQCAAQRTVMQKWRRPPDTSVWGSRSFHDAETKSKPACLPRHGTREVRYFEHKSPIFLKLLRKNRLNCTNLWIKKLGSSAILEIF